MKIKKCYLCKSAHIFQRSGSVRDNKRLKILECIDCGLVFLSSNKHIKKLHYENSGMHNGKKPNVTEWLKQAKSDDLRRYRFLKNYIINKKVIDFGCGAGGFLKYISKFVKKADGIELEKAMQQSFMERKLNVYTSYENAAQSKKKWDILTAFHVVEHLVDPKEILLKLSKLLKDNGKIIIEVPNSEDALLTLYENKAFQNFTYWSQHLYLFNDDNLKELAKQAKLKVEWIKHIQRYALSNHLFWLSKGKPGGHKVWKFLNNVYLNRNYEKQLASKGITDTIMICLKK
ncbi:class I SAM-dependent methyltransferase [Candidatus Pelagibacter sp. HIMB1495]|uniref:class I SAM-dependent methyltransferase n=1 Tax=unclassified Candidatus Pelagibacter TaxID=2647897 RepID=UPI003F840A7A